MLHLKDGVDKEIGWKKRGVEEAGLPTPEIVAVKCGAS